MKLSNLFLFTGAAITSYLLVKNRESITDEISDTGQLLHKAQDSLSEIQANLSYLREQKSTLEDISKDLQYKINVFNQFKIFGNLLLSNKKIIRFKKSQVFKC